MAMTVPKVTGVVVRQEWTDDEAVLVTVKLTPLGANDFAAIVAARAFKGDAVVLVVAGAGEDADDVDALVNP